MYPDELVLELAPECLDVLLFLEVRVDPVGQEQPRAAAGDGQAEARQVMQLAEGAREGRLAAVVRAADHEDPFWPFQVEVIGDDRATGRHQLVRQRDIEGVLGDLLRAGRDPRVAERQAGRLMAADQLKVGEVELHLAVEPPDRLVEVVPVVSAVDGKRAEHVRVQLRHQADDPGLNMVHLRVLGEMDQVALHRALLELRERLPHLGAVVRLTFVAADRDPGPLDPDGVPDPRKRVFQRLRLRGQRGETLRAGVPGEVAAEPAQAARGHIARGELLGQRAHRLAVDLGRVQEPGLFLQLVVELPHLLEVLAHLPHRLREPGDRLEHLALLQVAQNLMPVPDGIDLVQRRIEQRFQLVLLAPRGHRLQHLIQVQVGEEVRLLRPAGVGPCPRLPEENALEARRDRFRARPRAGRCAIRSEERAGSGQVRSGHQLPPVVAR